METKDSENIEVQLQEIESLIRSNPHDAVKRIEKISHLPMELNLKLKMNSLLGYALRIQGKEGESKKLYDEIYRIANETGNNLYKGEALYGLSEIVMNYDVEKKS